MTNVFPVEQGGSYRATLSQNVCTVGFRNWEDPRHKYRAFFGGKLRVIFETYWAVIKKIGVIIENSVFSRFREFIGAMKKCMKKPSSTLKKARSGPIEKSVTYFPPKVFSNFF